MLARVVAIAVNLGNEIALWMLAPFTPRVTESKCKEGKVQSQSYSLDVPAAMHLLLSLCVLHQL